MASQKNQAGCVYGWAIMKALFEYCQDCSVRKTFHELLFKKPDTRAWVLTVDAPLLQSSRSVESLPVTSSLVKLRLQTSQNTVFSTVGQSEKGERRFCKYRERETLSLTYQSSRCKWLWKDLKHSRTVHSLALLLGDSGWTELHRWQLVAAHCNTFKPCFSHAPPQTPNKRWQY